MIYKIYLIDGDSGISLSEVTFKRLQKIQDGVITSFFSAINRTIDNIHQGMVKGRKINEMTRVLESEDSIVVIYYHPLSRVLFCSISDADDEIQTLRKVMQKIGIRFWKKHRADIKTFRETSEKKMFSPISVDIENLTMGGRIAEVFPRLLVPRNVLEKVLSMGMIEDSDFQVAVKCNKKNSPLKIARELGVSRIEINEILKKLEKLDIIQLD